MAKTVSMKKVVSKKVAGGCAAGGAPRWVMYASLAILFAVTLTLVYQWMTARAPGGRAREGFFSDAPKYTLMYVRMEGCGYCVQFSSGAWAELKGGRAADLAAMKVVAKEYDREDPEFQASGIRAQAFPTIVLVDNGTKAEAARYGGERSADAIVAWVKATIAARA